MTKKITYTCPMHPEVEQEGPGDCPICGMSLEPKDTNVEDDATELTSMKRRFWVCAALSLPLLLLVMGGHFEGRLIDRYISPVVAIWIEFLLATPVMVWGALPFLKRGWASVLSGSLNMFTLISLGTGVAYGYSIIAILFPGVFPNEMRMENGLVDVYFEAASVIITLVLLGQVLELRARAQTNRAIRSLLDLAPKTARIIRSGGSEEDIPLNVVKVGDRLRVRPGDSVPVDGVIIEGEGLLDESMITGESMPVIKDKSDLVTGATLNQSGSFIMEARRVGSETVLSRIVSMVADAQRSRAPIQKVADIMAGYFVPTVIFVAIITAIGWFFLGPQPVLSYAIINAVGVLIIACPCAVGLATPMSIMVGVGRGAHEGVLIKNAESLERIEKVNVLVIDKTGTLTEGKPKVTSVIPLNGAASDDVLKLAASLERGSTHPLGMAIISEAKRQNLKLKDVKDFKSFSGKGITGVIDGEKVALGNEYLVESINTELQQQVEQQREKGETVVFVISSNKVIGLIGNSDSIKGTTSEALKQLSALGMRIIMLTGDNQKTARVVAQQLAIDEIKAGILPEGKRDVIKDLQEKGYRVAMAGDGVNDAPALALADVGIAMGTGADIAKESAEVTLIKGDLMGIVKARRLSKATMVNIRQNLFFAFVYNVLGVPVAAGILYPFIGVLLNPIIASIAMVCSSLSVITNALRLRRMNLSE